jgi:chemotaxis signal transduction protein
MTESEKAGPSGPTSARALIFRLGGERLAFPLEAVIEVFELTDPPARVPGAPLWVGGLINHHGQVVPVIRLDVLMATPGAGPAGQVILVEAAGERIGLLVEQIEALDELRVEGPSFQGRRRCWARGQQVELLEPGSLGEGIFKRLDLQGTPQGTVDGMARA